MVTQKRRSNLYEEADFEKGRWTCWSATFLFLDSKERERGECDKNEKTKIGGSIQHKILERNEISLCSCNCS